MLIAQSRQATRWRHGRRTTSRGALRHSRHSDVGSSSAAPEFAVTTPADARGADGGYVEESASVGFGAVGAVGCAATEDCERP